MTRFKRAKREGVNVITLFSGGTGSGKTYSALQYATGLAGGKPFAFIDTEARRGLHYADQFTFEHYDMRSPFRPSAYMEAVQDAEKEGFPVVVIDSITHEHLGVGGVLDLHDAELDRLAGENYGKREAYKMKAWINPKAERNKFIDAFVQTRIHIVMCARAKEKVEITKDGNGKTVIRPMESAIGLNGWMPLCAEEFPFEATNSFMMFAERPGIPVPIKLQEQHRHIFPLDKRVGREQGEAMAKWAAGETAHAQTLHNPPKRDDRVPTVAEVRQAIVDAKTPADISSVGALANRLTSAERKQLRTQFEEKKAVIESSAKEEPQQRSFDPKEFADIPDEPHMPAGSST